MSLLNNQLHVRQYAGWDTKRNKAETGLQGIYRLARERQGNVSYTQESLPGPATEISSGCSGVFDSLGTIDRNLRPASFPRNYKNVWVLNKNIYIMSKIWKEHDNIKYICNWKSTKCNIMSTTSKLVIYKKLLHLKTICKLDFFTSLQFPDMHNDCRYKQL